MKKTKEKAPKVKRERKPMKNTDKFMLVFLTTLIIYLAIMLPIRLCAVSFSWHWFVFGLIAVVIPFAFIHFQLWSQKNLSFTEDQKKNANVITVKFILYFWFLDCLYMTIFNQWKLWIYILGLITIIKIFYSLTIAFLGKKQKNTMLDINLVFDFLLGVGLSVYLIYLIPGQFANLQTIVTTIVAAVYGGLLTLIGVAWTIKHSDKQKREDELAKAKPMFTFNIVAEKDIKAHKQKICLINDSKTPQSLIEAMQLPHGVVSYMEIENSDNSTFLIKKLYFDFCWHSVSANNIVLPNNKLIIQLFRKELFEHAIMEVDDIYNRKFYYDRHFLCIPPLPNVEFCTLIELTEITLQELKSRNIPLD